MIEDLIGGNSVYPCVQTGISPKVRQGLPYLYENVLKQIVRILMAADQAADMPIESFGICIHNTVESLFMLPLAE